MCFYNFVDSYFWLSEDKREVLFRIRKTTGNNLGDYYYGRSFIHRNTSSFESLELNQMIVFPNPTASDSHVSSELGTSLDYI